MTAAEIITKFETFIDDTLDSTLEYQLLNDAMHEVEEEVAPFGLRVIDTSQSTTVGQTYTTAIPLPSDFFLPQPVIWVGDTPYTQVPFTRYMDYKDLPGYFYIDVANNVYHLTGTQVSAETITFPYIYTTPDLTASDSPAWPPQFHSIIPLKMAQIYYAIDGGDKQRAWDDRWAAMYDSRLKRFKDYDQDLKLGAMAGSALPPTGGMNSENRIIP